MFANRTLGRRIDEEAEAAWRTTGDRWLWTITGLSKKTLDTRWRERRDAGERRLAVNVIGAHNGLFLGIAALKVAKHSYHLAFECRFLDSGI